MTFIKNLKTIVGRSLGARAEHALTASTHSTSSFTRETLTKALEITGKLFGEKEWQCPCGHKFRAAGEWVACAPIYCEVPSCPNPKYYIDGPGRALLEANPSGVKLAEVRSDGVRMIDRLGVDTSKPSSPSVGVRSRFK